MQDTEDIFDDDLELLQTEDAEQDGVFERWRGVVDKGQSPLRVDKYLSEHIAGASRSRIQAAADAGNVLANGKVVSSNYKVHPLDTLQVLLDHEPQDYTITAEDIPVDVVYEDEDVLVVNKPAGLVVHPGHGHHEHTLLNALAWHFRDDEKVDMNNPQIGLVHRIDKDTSGLLLVAKTPQAKTALGMQFFNHTTRRTYNALVWGTFGEDEGTITGALARDMSDRTCFRVYEDTEAHPEAKEAVTHWRVIERLRYVTLVECRLETGRTHQIRVHMKHIGHPLFADEKYGGCEILKGLPTQKYKRFVQNCIALCPRQALHAKTLGFRHPRTGEEMFFDSEWAEDFGNLIEKWRKYGQNNE